MSRAIIVSIVRNVCMCVIVVWLFLSFLTLAPLNAADTTEQVISHIDQILEENPLPAGKKLQMIKIAEDDTITFFIIRVTGDVVIKPHIHKTHDETIYIIKGTTQMFINDKWVKLRPGSVHFNPMGKVHALKHTGTEPLVGISIFTPAMKEVDRHFLE